MRGDDMVISCPGEEWAIKMGPITRTNEAATRKQAEDGALQQINEGVKEIMEAAKPLIPLLLKGASCAGDCTPAAKDAGPEAALQTYMLNNGSWFCIASSGFFGVKIACKK